MFINIFSKLLVCLFCIVFNVFCISDLSYDSISEIYLEHELKHGAGFIKYDSIVVNVETRTDIVSETIINDSDLKLLKELAFNNELYRLKVTVKTLSGKETTFMTFTKPCLLIASNLNIILSINFDHLDYPFSVNLATTYNSCNNLNEFNTNKFRTVIFFRRPDASPMPDTATYIQKLDREREAREKGKSNNNKSMLGKYWMYILPLVIFMMIAGASNPEVRQ